MAAEFTLPQALIKRQSGEIAWLYTAAEDINHLEMH
jgi:hypothetical protein